ncbi:general substrate transporter, partial [Plectosphaerella plurivora]
GSMMNGLQTLPQWRNYFNRPSAPVLGAINAVYPVSKILGLFPVGWMSDRWGRKLPMWIGLAILLAGPAIQASSTSLVMFIVSRAIVGVGTVFLALPCPILVAELSYPTHRGKITALYNTFFFFGAIAAAWVTYGTFRIQSTWAWRIPSALQAGIPFLQLLGLWWVPESPRWLIANGRHAEARAIFTRWHAAGVEASPLVDFEMAEIEKALELERAENARVSWLSLVKTASNRKRMLIACVLGFGSQWNGIGVVSYYLTLVLNTIGIDQPKDQTLINGLLQLFNFAAAVFAGAMMVDRFGRRRLLLVSTGGLLLAYVVWTALTAHFIQSKDQAAGRAVVAFIFIAFFFYDIAWTPLVQAYTVEIFPYTTRARGLTTTLTSSYIGLISAQLINPIGLTNLGWKYYIVFCCLIAFLFGIIFIVFPETKGRSLEQIAELFDGKQLAVEADVILSKGHDDEQVEELDHTSSGKGPRQVAERV